MSDKAALKASFAGLTSAEKREFAKGLLQKREQDLAAPVEAGKRVID